MDRQRESARRLQRADTVEKVENRRAPKISQKSDVGDLNRSRAL
jgi:hypothetical protein